MVIRKILTLLLLLRISVLTNCIRTCSDTDLHALVLARGGSRGIRYKNLVSVGGRSLLSRTILEIKKSGCFEHIWVSTDDKFIATEAKKYGALVHNRLKQYALDGSTSIDAVKEFLSLHKTINNISLFQCTSVFLKQKYIRQAVWKFKKHACVFGIKRTYKLRWHWTDNQLIPANFKANARPRRQDWSGDIVEAGMFYLSKRSLIMNGILQNNLCATVDIEIKDTLEIDTFNDLDVARCLILKNK